MTSSSRPSTGSRLLRWLQGGQTVERAAPQPDPADMGTCFGLEMSLDESPQDPFSRPAKASAPAPWGRTAPGSI